ncbi:MAG: alpha-amylase family glycosyl hydrolase [Acetivibrio sp.]
MKKKVYKRFWIFLLLVSLLLTGCSHSTDSTIKKQNIEKEKTESDHNCRTYYEVFVYSFCDSNGDGIGDIPGLISKLNYIEELGFNGIWLMPIMPSTTYHKYDVIDYYTIDEQYGTLEDFKTLLAECKKRDIRVIMDMVFNHTSTKNVWFTQAAEYLKTLDEKKEPDLKECPYVDYYHFKKEAANQAGYYKIEGTPWYYEGVFWDQMPDLNLDSKALRKDLEKITSFWMNLGVEGFRLDAAKEYFTGNKDKNIEVLSWYEKYVKSVNPEAYLVAEVWDSFQVIGSYYKSGIDSIFNYTFGNNDGLIVKTLNRAGDGKGANKYAQNLVIVTDYYKKNQPNMIDAPFLSNHDTGRVSGFVGRDSNKVKLAGAMNLFMSGSAFVYYGEELGMSGSGKDENKRAPMYWNTEGSKGTTVPPPDMDVVEHSFGSLKEQEKDKNSIYQYYKKAIHLRRKYPEISGGNTSLMEEIKDGDICAIEKTYGEEKIFLLFNISQQEKEIVVSKKSYPYRKMMDYLTVNEEKPRKKGERITLPPFGIVILK